MKLLNGGVYKSDKLGVFVLIYETASWGLMKIDRSAIKGMSAPMFIHDKQGSAFFSERGLRYRFDSDNWKLLDGRLRIEKIDPEMSLVDYPNGELEEMK